LKKALHERDLRKRNYFSILLFVCTLIEPFLVDFFSWFCSHSVGAAERIFEIIDIAPLIPIQSLEGSIVPSSFAGNITLKDVTFSYASRPDCPVLKVCS
jgi:ABC-type multidrug transport system fused ATPase/permease subunit